jgi:hypothetical protein
MLHGCTHGISRFGAVAQFAGLFSQLNDRRRAWLWPTHNQREKQTAAEIP